MYKILFIILLSLAICSDTITQVTDIFPGGIPKEITIYQIADDLNANFTLLPSKRYQYHPDGQLHKYQEYWNNGQKSKEILIQREQIIERNWSIEGFPKDTNKFKKEDYEIPTINTNKTKSKMTLSELSTKIEKMKRDLTGLASNINKINNSLSTLKNEDIKDNKDNLESFKDQIYQLEEELNNLKNEASAESISNDDGYKNLEIDINKKIDNMKQDIKTIKSEIKSIKKKKKK